ncbi:putative Clp protease subunit [Leifsonia rubra CMS 76R]|nr:putative Clp protease subunit [Leifsonia rubra CMS 76R]
MFEKFAQTARSAVEDARFEAGRRGDRRIGTDHLLLALLRDEDLARAVGVDADSATEATDELDRGALRSIGLELSVYKPAANVVLQKRAPFTAGAKAVLQQTLVHASAEKARTITSRHIMLALLDRQAPDPVFALFESLSIEPQEVSDRLTAET